MGVQLIKESDKLKEHNLDLKESLKSLEEVNKSLKIEINKIRNLIETCETCVSPKKKVNDLHEILGKFTQGKEKFDLILSSQNPSLNPYWLGFKKDRNPRKVIDHKKKNCLFYKFTHYKRVGHLEPFYFEKFRRYKSNNLRSSRTNELGPKNMWVPNVKP